MSSTPRKIMLRCYHPEDQDCGAVFMVITLPPIFQETIQRSLKALEECGADKIEYFWYFSGWELRTLKEDLYYGTPEEYKFEETEPYENNEEIDGVHLSIYKDGEVQFTFPYNRTDSGELGFTNSFNLEQLKDLEVLDV